MRSGSLWAITASALPGQSPKARRPLGGGTRSAPRFAVVLPALLLTVPRGGRALLRRFDTWEHRAPPHLPTTAVSPSGAPVAGNGNARFGAAFQAYSDCLKKNGVTLPSFAPRNRSSGQPSGQPTARPSGSAFRGGLRRWARRLGSPPAGVSADAWAKAQQACASLRPSFAPGQGRPGAAGGIDATALAAHAPASRTTASR